MTRWPSVVTGSRRLPISVPCRSPRLGSTGKASRRVILNDAPSPHESFYWRLGRGDRAQWVVREGSWKLLGNPKDTSHKGELTKADQRFLVNLADDITEMTNVATDHPDVVQRLSAIHDRYEAELPK